MPKVIKTTGTKKNTKVGVSCNGYNTNILCGLDCSIEQC